MEVSIKYISNIALPYKKQLEEKIIFGVDNFHSLPFSINQFGDEKQGTARFYNKDEDKIETKSTTIFESFFFKLDSFDGKTAFYSEVFLDKTDEHITQMKLW